MGQKKEFLPIGQLKFVIFDKSPSASQESIGRRIRDDRPPIKFGMICHKR